jgi:Spy/CpxP family protein refolding chaperone
LFLGIWFLIKKGETKMKRACLLILVGLIVAYISVPVVAEPNEPKGACGLKAGKALGGGPGMESGCRIGMVLKMKEELGLSDTQVQQLEALKGETQEKMKAGMEAVKAKREALEEAVKSGAEEGARCSDCSW